MSARQVLDLKPLDLSSKNILHDEPLQHEKISGRSEDYQHLPIRKEVCNSHASSPVAFEQPDHVDLSHLISDRRMVDYLNKKKIHHLFSWQVECLRSLTTIDEGKNFVISAPISAGKSFVADIFALKCIIDSQKKVIIITPFVSMVREKFDHLRKILKATKYRVGCFSGTCHSSGGPCRYDISVCTVEKANAFINECIVERTHEMIGVVIIDQFHDIGERKRGPILELILTKLLSLQRSNPSIQLVAMSAPIPNLDDLARWLQAIVFKTELRPVPLIEKLMVGRTIYQVGAEFKQVGVIDEKKLENEAGVDIFIVIQSIIRQDSVLLFLNDKNQLENLTKNILGRLQDFKKQRHHVLSLIEKSLDTENINRTLDLFKSCQISMPPLLSESIRLGIAYYHANLCLEHRGIIEKAFRAGWIRVLLTTSILAVGVHLSSRLVIVKGPKLYDRIMDGLLYRQMIGRAGRVGVDSEGQSILLCAPEEASIGKQLAKLPMKPVLSMMFNEKPDQPHEPLARALLDVIVTNLASTDKDIDEFLSKSYCSSTSNESSLIPVHRETAITFLINRLFISRKSIDNETHYEASNLGRATIAGSFNLNVVIRLNNDLQFFQKCLDFNHDLHLLYLIVPSSFVQEFPLNRDKITQLFTSRDGDVISCHVLRLIKSLGLEAQGILNELLGGGLTSERYKKLIAALILQDITSERSLEDICHVYGMSEASLQNLQNSTVSFGGLISSFCNQINWKSEHLTNLDRLIRQVQFAVRPDLLDLMSITLLNRQLARALHDRGLHTVGAVADSSSHSIESIIRPVIESNNGHNALWIESVRQSMTADVLAHEVKAAACDCIQPQAAALVDESATESDPADSNGPLRKRRKN